METVKRADLEALLRIPPGKDLFLSAFLATSIEDKNKRGTVIFLKKKARQLERMYAANPEHLEDLRKNLERLNAFLDGEVESSAGGVAVFSSARRDFFKTFQLSAPFENRLVIGDAPYIGPLAEIVEGKSHHVVVLIDNKHGRILSVYLWRVLEEKTLGDEEIPSKIKVGGWSQMRFQRHHHDRVHHFHKELVDALVSYVKKNEPDHLVLLGQDRSVSEFLGLLPTNLRQKVLLTQHMDLAAPAQEVVRRLRPIIEAETAKANQSLLERLEDQIRQDHLAVGGIEETLQCLQEGRVDTLVLSRNAKLSGAHCASCGYLFGSMDGKACPFCAGALESIDLGERMVEIAEKHRTPVEFIHQPGNEFLAGLEGVGGFLKY